ncbi:MAG: 30S ribosomal protein S9 [Bacteroidetes bacterium]|nr:MAG: 30S ribosomal protein S9 [Bacteroidota bacterium]
MDTVNATGRRKASIARIYLKDGKGNITVNKKTLDEYFTIDELKYQILRPFSVVEAEGKYDLIVNLKGGGFKGQAEALRLAISRALVKINPDDKSALKKEGFLTRDARVVERKKPGQPKARKKFQFSKR